MNVRDQNTLNQLWDIFSQDSRPTADGTSGVAIATDSKPSLATDTLTEGKEDCKTDKENVKVSASCFSNNEKDEEDAEEGIKKEKKKKKKKKQCVEEDAGESKGSMMLVNGFSSFTETKVKKHKIKANEAESEEDRNVEDNSSSAALEDSTRSKKKKKKRSKIAKCGASGDEETWGLVNGLLSKEKVGPSPDSEGSMADGWASQAKQKRKKKKGLLESEEVEHEMCGSKQLEEEIGSRIEDKGGSAGGKKKTKRKHLLALGDNNSELSEPKKKKLKKGFEVSDQTEIVEEVKKSKRQKVIVDDELTLEREHDLPKKKKKSKIRS